MIPIYEIRVIHVEVTNGCNLRCANCTRFVGHHKKPFFMDLDTVAKAIDSLEGYPGNIGMMGGEPTLHPQFPEICKIFQEMIPDKRRRQLWTNGHKWNEYKKIIDETFDPDLIIYNDHSNPDVGEHQPLLIAAEDVVEDETLMWELIDKCWIQPRWSASMTPKGGFFCEVAAAQDSLFNGPGGYPLEKGWWNKTPDEFADQVKRYCPKCSAAIPLNRPSSHNDWDLISEGNALNLKKAGSPKYLRGKVMIHKEKYSRRDLEKWIATWTPWSHRPYKQSAPDKIWT